MSRKRAFALLASLLAILAMTLGVTGTAAQAGRKHYPPTPPSLVVDKGIVKRGVTVHATGNEYGKNERVTITITFRANGSHRATTRRVTVKTDRKGRFTYSVKTSAGGTFTITANGKSSRKNASVVVIVIDNHKGGNGHHNGHQGNQGGNGHHGNQGRQVRRVSYTSSSTVGTPATESSSAIAGITIAVLLAFAGGTVITRRVIRRRQRA